MEATKGVECHGGTGIAYRRQLIQALHICLLANGKHSVQNLDRKLAVLPGEVL